VDEFGLKSWPACSGDHAGRHGRGSRIGRSVIWRLQPCCAPTATPPPGWGRRLTRHWPAVRWHARQAARRSSLEPIAPAIASSRNVRTGKARRPGSPCLPGTPRRPRARTDHTSHSSPATCRCAAGVQAPAAIPFVIAHHVTLRSRPGRSRGPRAPPPGPEPAGAAGRYHRAWAASCSAAGSPGRACHAGTIRVSPSTGTERPRSRQIQARSRCRARHPRQRGHYLRARPAGQIEPGPHPALTGTSGIIAA